jgi:DNA-3-methyladenine glycosylase
MYYCFNVVTEKKGIGEAVLIRALEPIEGLDLMKKRRKAHRVTADPSPHRLCNGPGKLVLAMGITSRQNHADLTQGSLYLLPPQNREKQKIVTGSRIGIRHGVDLPLRYWLQGNPCVSRHV